MSFTCKVHTTARGNLFIRDAADLVANVLNDVGVPTTIAVDEIPQGVDGTVDIIVGPHEYFVVDVHVPLEQRLDIAARAVMVTTEPPGSPFWELQRQMCEVAPLTIDISAIGVAAFAELGIDALRLHLGYHPSLDRWGGPAPGGLEDGRDVDVTFMGAATGLRLEKIGPAARVLSHHETRLLFHDGLVPVTSTGPTYLAGTEKADLLRRSKILLNVHREGDLYFEWLRAVEAICNGALLLTEPSEGYAPLEPFQHLVVSEPALFGAHITALLADESRRARLAADAYDFLRSDLTMTDTVRGTIVDALEAQAGSHRPSASAIDLAFRSEPPTHSGEVTLLDVPSDELSDTRTRLKDGLTRLTRAERRIDRLTAELDGRDAEGVVELTTPAWAESAHADLTVVVPLYNYEHLVEPALDSVLASQDIRAEIIVIDDCSSDGSANVLADYIERHPEHPILGLLRATNAGPSAARTLGVERSRTDQFFLLDADNDVYPRGLRLLKDALDPTDAAFAYGILEIFGERSTLVSAMPFTIESLVRRPYIDTMCLYDRSIWEKLGGFPDDEEGYEDYAYFLAVAASGNTAVSVPQIVGRYRRHPESRGLTASLDLVNQLNVLRTRFPGLPWPPS